MNCPIVFTTAYNEYWQRAFETNSIDYLLKPISKSMLHKAIDRSKKVKGFYTKSSTEEKFNDFMDKVSAQIHNKNRERFLLKWLFK